jgi:hypothetical protein
VANPIIKILRGATPPAALQAGQLAMDQVAKNFYLGVEVAGVVTNEIVGGEGTFATKTYVDSAVSSGTGSLAGTVYSPTPPSDPTESMRWVDSNTLRAYEYVGGAWIEIVSS